MQPRVQGHTAGEGQRQGLVSVVTVPVPLCRRSGLATCQAWALPGERGWLRSVRPEGSPSRLKETLPWRGRDGQGPQLTCPSSRQVHDYLRSKLCSLYENDCIFDKFECAWNGSDR